MTLGDLTIGYLFLGGVGAGALSVLIVLDLLTPGASQDVPGGISWAAPSASSQAASQAASPERPRAAPRSRQPARYVPQPDFRPLFLAGYRTGGGVLALSVLCLLLDLGRPDHLPSLFLHPSPSYLVLGAYVLVLLLVCVAVLCRVWASPPVRVPRLAVRAVEVLGLAAAFVTMLYTGLLFQSIGTGTLLGTVLVPVIFVLSSLSTGIALLLLTAALTRAGRLFATTFRRLARADAALVLLEGASLALLLVLGFDGQQAQAQAVAGLLSGDFAPVFWVGVVGCGLVAPLAFEGASLRGGTGTVAAHWGHAFAPVALLLLVGGCCLRVSLLGAGLPAFTAATALGAA
jgi:formate-dependent nitrite reductase membrane component NrfD